MTDGNKSRGRIVGVIAAGAVFVYGVIYIDVVMRAKEAVREGDKYMEWHRNPAQKAAHFENWYQAEVNKLEKTPVEDYNQKVASLKFERDFNINESSLKYAYQWYKDAYELFSPPQSKWVKAARQKAPETLALWKEELRAKKIPFEDYMFE